MSLVESSSACFTAEPYKSMVHLKKLGRALEGWINPLATLRGTARVPVFRRCEAFSRSVTVNMYAVFRINLCSCSPNPPGRWTSLECGMSLDRGSCWCRRCVCSMSLSEANVVEEEGSRKWRVETCAPKPKRASVMGCTAYSWSLRLYIERSVRGVRLCS